MFDEFILNGLHENHVVAINQLCTEFSETTAQQQPAGFPSKIDTSYFSEYLSAVGILQSLLDAYHINYDQIKFTDNTAKNIHSIKNFFTFIANSISAELAMFKLEESKKKHSARWGASFTYEFSDDEIKVLQDKIHDLRGIITSLGEIDEDHKMRLLKRLEALQSELHKKVSDLDKFWGLIGDAGVVIGKFGKDAKPFVGQIKEITNLIWRAQSRAEGLPETDVTPLLSEPSDSE